MSGKIVNPWTPGTTYPPGSTVRPTTVTGTSASPPNNPGFETGNLTGWTAGAGFSVVTTSPYLGTYCAQLAAGAGSNITLVNTNQAPISLIFGQNITVNCYINAGAASSGANGHVTITFYDAGHAVLATYVGNTVAAIGSSGWVKSTITASQFAAAYVSIGCSCTNTSGSPMFVDNFTWDYQLDPYTAQQLFYAVQTGTGKSGSVEPTWATTPPNITDGTVTWSSIAPTSITWYTQPLLKSGGLEPGTFGGPPAWPTIPGQSLHDTLSTPPSGMDWIAITPQISDTNCPQSKYVFAASSKIFALDTDICRYCATTNPLDWTTEADAGFLPVGLQAYGTNPFIAAGLYRSNGVFLNAQGLQMWQLDEDPANMALLDAIPIGCTQHETLASINNDLFFLAGQGVRTMGISAGSGNLQAGDVGMPIDPLVQAAMTWANANSVKPIGGYFPSLGQYFLAFPGWPADDLFWSSGGSATASGTNTYVVTLSGVTAYAQGWFAYVTFTNASTGASTLNINGLGARSIEDHTKITAGSKWIVYYNSVLDRFDISGGITRLFVYTMSRVGEVGAWSHYLYQFVLENFCQAGDDLYMRGTMNNVPMMLKFDPTANIDTNQSTSFFTYAIVQWPWLDDGQPGQTKQLSGFDASVTLTNPSFQTYTFEIGYDQTNKAAFTTPYTLTGDTVTGMMYPIQVKAPSFSLRLTFESITGWSVQMAELYITDKRLTS